MENAFSSPRSETNFPAGLRVLVVDDDPTWLKILEKMLKKCSYEVTTCGLATDALRLLRERKDGFDIVISDVNMPDMDGFKLLEHVGLEMDLPVIMMSVDGETSRVMKGVQHGACDYLLKPIRMKELKNIWQHVFRKKIHEIRDIESHESLEAMMLRNGSDIYEDGLFLGAEEISCSRKRKDSESNNRHDEKDFGDSSSAKKARVVWSVDLHQKFVRAVNHIGFDKVGPKKILDLMSVPWLTRENVASHLQKYRLYLSRLQKEKEINEPKTTSFAGTKSSDIPQKEPPANGIYGYPSNTVIPCSVEHHNKCEDNLEPIISEPILEPKIPEFSWPAVAEIHKSLLHLENSFTKLPLPDPSSHSKPSTAERGLSANNGPIKTSTNKRPIYLDYGASSTDSFHEDLEPIIASRIDFESSQKRLLTFGSGASLVAFDEDLQFLFRGDYGIDDACEVGFLEFSDPVISEDLVPFYSCDSIRFGSDNPYNYDPNEYASLLT